MRKLYENFHIFHFKKRIVSAETIRGNTVFIGTQNKKNFSNAKGQIKPKADWRAVDSPKKRTNKYFFFCCEKQKNKFVRLFFGRICGTTILFRDLLTFSHFAYFEFLTNARIWPYENKISKIFGLLKTNVIS